MMQACSSRHAAASNHRVRLVILECAWLDLMQLIHLIRNAFRRIADNFAHLEHRVPLLHASQPLVLLL